MAIKDELVKDIKDSGGGDDELEALDALEREAAEFNKVSRCTTIATIQAVQLTGYMTGCGNRSHTQGFQIGCVRLPPFLPPAPLCLPASLHACRKQASKQNKSPKILSHKMRVRSDPP